MRVEHDLAYFFFKFNISKFFQQQRNDIKEGFQISKSRRSVLELFDKHAVANANKTRLKIRSQKAALVKKGRIGQEWT